MNLLSRGTLALSLVLGTSTALTVGGLEGGLTGQDPIWKKAPPVQQPTDAERAKEVAAREAAMKADIARLKERMSKTPSASDKKLIDDKLQVIYDTKGWSEESKTAYELGAIEMYQQGQTELPAETLEAFVQFNKDMKARGIDLILLPATPKLNYESHLLFDGVDAKTEVWPGWSNMMVQLLEHDIEVIDTVDEFRAAASGKVPVVWKNDGHTGPEGRRIMGEALAKRLQRYEFARTLQAKPKAWEIVEKERTGTAMVTLLNNRAWINERWWEKTETRRNGTPFPYDDPQAVDAGLRVKAQRSQRLGLCLSTLKTQPSFKN